MNLDTNSDANSDNNTDAVVIHISDDSAETGSTSDDAEPAQDNDTQPNDTQPN